MRMTYRYRITETGIEALAFGSNGGIRGSGVADSARGARKKARTRANNNDGDDEYISLYASDPWRYLPLRSFTPR